MINPEAEGLEQRAEAAAGGGRKRGKGRLVIIVVLLAALAAGGYFARQVFFADDPAADATAAEEQAGSRSNAQYLALDPPLVVNFAAGGKLRYLQVSVEVMSRDGAAIETVQRHTPAVRNALIALFSERDYEALLTRDGKEALRQEALEVIRQELTLLTGEPQAEDVYFSSFVMQ
ncbi:flagellar basal body-associated FliL family protein [Thioalkalivibrio sp. XN8]|uniref:flagellar basal body-associated FliL family protein n=1 Tax=Thioalkalivibrio sp. XN8 TaxID=2712863 RepID=UPI0013ED53F0|nr:flagellar basal body-associated FliL family protein [Thioalkalivibrio sp. XN8]NGP52526.1 flagellar basal body-associated protein FliL [Thioalkalivibrio sp. XN8]